VSADPVRVLVVDDDAMVRSTLRVMLGGAEDIAVVDMLSGPGEITAELLARSDVVLMDIVMMGGDGLEATGRISAVDGAPAVIVMTTFDTEAHLLEALRQGASGFLLKDTEPERIVEAVRRAAAGEPALSASITRRLMHRVRDQTRSQARAKERLGVLSPREVQIARAIARGRSNGEIAAELFISLGTVKSHISQILAKLELTGRVGISLLVSEAEAAAGDPPSV
jgi:DNA-binding NarL/FixJ family response regulator